MTCTREDASVNRPFPVKHVNASVAIHALRIEMTLALMNRPITGGEDASQMES